MISTSKANKGKRPIHAQPPPPLDQPPEIGVAMSIAGQNVPPLTQYRFRWDRLPFILATGPTQLDDNLTIGAIDCTSESSYIGATESVDLNLRELPSFLQKKVRTTKDYIKCPSVVVEASISSRHLRIGRGGNHKITFHVVPEIVSCPICLSIRARSIRGRPEVLGLLSLSSQFHRISSEASC